MTTRTHAKLRARLRELASKLPPGAAEWPQHRAAQFKADVRAAHRAADHPMATDWVLQQALHALRMYYPPQP